LYFDPAAGRECRGATPWDRVAADLLPQPEGVPIGPAPVDAPSVPWPAQGRGMGCAFAALR